MSKKENKGGVLTNEQIEQDLKVSSHEKDGYHGMQDTGDRVKREEGSQVQQKDGLPENGNNEK
jgi:hypothetical protein